MQNTKFKEFSAGRAGNGSVNLATGTLTYVHEDINSDANILPINISHVYSSSRALDTTNQDVTYGKGFKLNLQQTLKKTFPNNSNDTQYTYIDASGNEHTFEDRYYYIGTNGKKVYVSKLRSVDIDADGKLTYTAGNVKYDIFTQQISESGLTLQSELKAFNGSKKLETRHEEIVQLTEEIFQLEKSIADLEYSLNQYKKHPEEAYTDEEMDQETDDEANNTAGYMGIIKLQRKLERMSINISLNELENKGELSSKEQNEKKLLETRNKLRIKSNTYDDAERDDQKKRYDYLSGIAKAEIEKYKNLLGNKQDILNKLNVQIPVNFIIDKDDITMGFNAQGNLVALFDRYDNQVAIVYENGVITRIVDADNREIVFEYEYNSSVKGKLMSITDYNGHKTSFIYNSSSLRRIEYPNGETPEFLYTSEGLLNEMLPPSRIGTRLQYNENKRIQSIAELVQTEKIDKNGVSVGEKIAENSIIITNDGRTTVVRDIKSDIAESNLFDVDGNLLCVQTTEGNKLVNYCAYDTSSDLEAGNRHKFVMTADEIADDGITGIDIISAHDNKSVTLSGFDGEEKEWSADMSKLDSYHTDYILCASATALQAEKTPKRKASKYCQNCCEHDMTSTYRRFEYKVLVDYAGKTPPTPSPVYTPIETGDTINVLYFNDSFSLPSEDATNFFGDRIYSLLEIKYYYPILGNGSFSVSSTANQVYYTAKYNASLFNYACALWAGSTLLWCNSSYASKYNERSGWHQTSVNLSSWGPITVHHKKCIHNWGRFLSKDSIFHNGIPSNPNYAKDNQDPDIDEFIAGFDYRIKERQHVSLPITLREENGKPKMPKKISVIAHYKQSQGEAVFESPMLIKGNVAYAKIDESNNVVFESVSNPEKIAVNDHAGGYSTVKSSVETEYNDNNLPTEKRTKYTYLTKNGTSEKTAVERWLYNAQGSVIEHWGYVDGEELTSGIEITETVYDKRGNSVKSFTYNSLDASTKFYNEQELAENGRVLADIDEIGTHKICYEYDDVTGKVKSVISPNGGKFSYAHDTNTDEVTAITQSTDEDEPNTTNRVYTADYLTELTSGNNTVNYEYDNKGRKSAIFMNDKDPYIVYDYQERANAAATDVVTATLVPTDSALSYTVLSETDKNGNLVKVREGTDAQSLEESLVNTYYTDEDKDRKGLLKTSEDKIVGTKAEYSYNILRQPLSTIVRDSVTNSVISSETAEYDEYGQISKRSLISNGIAQAYGFQYKNNFARELERVEMPFDLCSALSTDVNGRVRERVLSHGGVSLEGEYIYYRKHGDHGTNQISSVRYGERKNGIYNIKDGISYTYDECGNISAIKENGKLSARYTYDKLNRLIREDNAKLNKTTLFTYDNNGNILSKREAVFSLKETEKFTEFTQEKEYCYDVANPDRLISFGNEDILGYDSIGNPTQYRSRSFAWQKGRQLASVTDEVNTLRFTYDASGRRMSKIAEGESTRYVYAGNMLLREERADENNIVYLGDSLLSGDNPIDGGGVVADSVNKYVVEYYYGQDGVAGLVYNGEKYYFRRNVQGDITRIYSIDGTLTSCYTYDAWGNHKVYDANGNENNDLEFIGNVNPYRYRGYYYDVETRLYYCLSRYYDPEVGRFINADDVSYIDPETINGLNLYAYCYNNPVMMVDEDGNKPKWWQWLLSAIQIVVGGVLVATGVGAGFGAMLLTSGAIGMVSNALGSTIGGGIGSMTNGFGAISTGISMLSFGIPGIIVGIGMIAVGAGTMIMGANEVVSGITGTNYMRDWMGGSLYDGLYIGLNITSAVGTIAGRLGMRAVGTKTIGSHDVLKAKGQHPYARITKGKNIYNFDARGNVYWSKHNIGMTNTGSPSGLHWHTSLGRDNNHIYSYIKLIIKLIFGGK